MSKKKRREPSGGLKAAGEPAAAHAPAPTSKAAARMLREVNDSRYGLSGSIWTNDLRRALRVARHVESGVLSINSHSSVHVEAPFGGFKQSGLGRDLGMAAMEGYTELKNIYVAE